MHVPDFSMCNTVFINLLANCLSTCVQNVRISMNQSCSVPNWLQPISPRYMNIGPVQSGQPRRIPLLISNNDIKDEMVFDIEYDGKRIKYCANKKDQPMLNIDDSKIFFSGLAKSVMLPILEKGLSSHTNHGDICGELQQLYNNISNAKKKYNHLDDEFNAWLDNIQSSDVHTGQLIKAFSNREYFNRWGTHYLRYFSRSHQLDMCTNFKDTSLQLYGGKLFKELRTEIEDIFSNIDVPQPSLSSKPFQGNFYTAFYQASNPCFDGNCLATVLNNRGGTEKRPLKHLKKGDYVVNNKSVSSKIVCIIKTYIKDSVTDMVLLDGLRVTPYHPIYYKNEWIHPYKIKEPMKVHCDATYNFVLESNHIMSIEGIDIITMGHDFTSDVLRHPFFGTQKVIECLKEKPGWSDGFIELRNYKPSYDENGLISGF